MIRHISLMKFKNNVSEDLIKDLMESLKKIEGDYKGIISFSWGKDISHQENFNKGYSHTFIFDFENSESRSTYLSCDEHKNKTNKILPYLEPNEILVFDYEIQDDSLKTEDFRSLDRAPLQD